MRKFILGVLASVALVTSAQADWNGHRHYQPHHHHGGGGGDAGVALFGGLVGGLIIGGMINNMNQPRYYNGPVYYEEPICQQVATGRYWNGWRWVYQIQTVCN